MDNKLLINHFKIFVIGHKLSFKSNEKVAKDIRNVLMEDKANIQDIQLYFCEYPIVKTTIFCKGMANTSTLLELGSVRTILENELNNLKPIN